MRLFLARHGETTSNVLRALDTAHPGADLTDRGREQAQKLADRLENEAIDTILVSHLVRTQQTAEPLATRLGITPIIDPRIAEISAGQWEMERGEEAYGSYVGTVRAWLESDPHRRMPGGETGQEVIDRFSAGVNAAAATSETLLVVAHGAVLMTWGNMVADRGDIPVLHHMVNTAVAELEGEPGAWRVVDWPINEEHASAYRTAINKTDAPS